MEGRRRSSPPLLPPLPLLPSAARYIAGGIKIVYDLTLYTSYNCGTGLRAAEAAGAKKDVAERAERAEREEAARTPAAAAAATAAASTSGATGGDAAAPTG